MSRWPLVSVAELGPLQYGAALQEKSRRGGAVPVYGSGNTVGWHNESLVDRGCVVVGRKGSAGSLRLSREPCWVIDTAYFSVPSNDVELDWWFFCLHQLNLPKYVEGSPKPGLPRDEVHKLLVPLPPLEEQRRILAEIEAKRTETASLRDQLKEQLEEMRRMSRAAVGSAVGGALPPVTYGASLQPGFVRLSDVARLETGHTPSRRHPEWWGGEVRWLALPDIRAVDGERVLETAERTNEEGLANSSARMLPAGSVAFSRTASVGFVTILGRDMAVSQDFAVWVCGPELDPDYLMQTLRFSRDHLLTASSGAIHKTIYMDDLKSFQILLPSIEEQRKIVDQLESVEAQTGFALGAVQQQLADLDSLDQAVLREVFA